MAIPIGLAVFALLGAANSAQGKRKAKSASRAEIARIRMQTAEEIRRRTGGFEQTTSQARALAGATGFGSRADGQVGESGGFANILESMQNEFSLEVDWLRKAADSGIDATRQTYKSTAKSIDYDYAGSLVSSFNTLGQTQNWWV